LSHLEDVDFVSLDVVLEMVHVQRRFELKATRYEGFHGALPLWLEIVASQSNLGVQARFGINAFVQRRLHENRVTFINSFIFK
jgi:hypothetical protein